MGRGKNLNMQMKLLLPAFDVLLDSAFTLPHFPIFVQLEQPLFA